MEINGRKFLVVSRVISEQGRRAIRDLGIDPYFITFGISIKTDIRYDFEPYEYHYVIDPENMYLYGWRILDGKSVAVVEERYQSVERVHGLSPDDFRPYPNFKEVVASTSAELVKWIGLDRYGR